MDLAKYYEEICKQPFLDRETERALFLKLRDNSTSLEEKKKIRDTLINSNLRFVFKQAKAYSKNDPESFGELIGAGNEGLIVGLEKYDPNCGVKFLTYAGWWVIQRILKEMSKMRIVSLPIWKQQLASRIQKVRDENESITLEQLKAMFEDVPPRDIEELYYTKYLTYYIEDMSDDPAFEINPIEEEVERRIEKEELTKRVMSMSEPYRSVIVFSFGLSDGSELTDAVVAKKLNLKRDEYKRVKERALKMLKEMYSGDPQ